MEGSATTPGGGQFGAEFRATGSGFQEQHGGQESPQQRQSLGHPFAPQIQEAPQKQVSTTKKRSQYPLFAMDLNICQFLNKNRSPSESRSRMWNSELAKHLQFDLVDTEGMSEQQLREIPYTVVETTSKRSNSNLKIHKSSSKSSVGAKSTGSGNTITNGSGSGNAGQARNRVDRIRG